LELDFKGGSGVGSLKFVVRGATEKAKPPRCGDAKPRDLRVSRVARAPTVGRGAVRWGIAGGFDERSDKRAVLCFGKKEDGGSGE
jgi:hypothetical protein